MKNRHDSFDTTSAPESQKDGTPRGWFSDQVSRVGRDSKTTRRLQPDDPDESGPDPATIGLKPVRFVFGAIRSALVSI